MLEPYEGKLSCTVLRGEGGSNALDLPDNPTNVEEASSMIYLPYDGCWILYNCMELCALIKELFELHLLSNC